MKRLPRNDVDRQKIFIFIRLDYPYNMISFDDRNEKITALYGLIGFPLQHSFSMKFFTEKFKNEQINARYLNFEKENLSDLDDILQKNNRLLGFNVTIPHKEQIISFLNEISDEAKKIGAVNVVKVLRDKHNSSFRLVGYNTDYMGFKESIEPLLDREKHTGALILGTGGASKSVAQVFTDLGFPWKKVSRNPDKDQLAYSDLSPHIIASHNIIVNTTPVGTFPNELESPAIPYSYLTSAHLVYDLVYNPEETQFLKQSKNRGAVTKNGLEMLERQALAAWQIWNQPAL